MTSEKHNPVAKRKRNLLAKRLREHKSFRQRHIPRPSSTRAEQLLRELRYHPDDLNS